MSLRATPSLRSGQAPGAKPRPRHGEAGAGQSRFFAIKSPDRFACPGQPTGRGRARDDNLTLFQHPVKGIYADIIYVLEPWLTLPC